MFGSQETILRYCPFKGVLAFMPAEYILQSLLFVYLLVVPFVLLNFDRFRFSLRLSLTQVNTSIPVKRFHTVNAGIRAET